MSAESRPRWLEGLWRAFSRLISVAPVTIALMKLATVVDRPLMRLSAGRLRLSFVIPMVLMDVRGARSGVVRSVPLLFVPDDLDLLLVASNGGQSRHPGWCFNLRAHPEVSCTLRGRTAPYTARELSGAERSRAWDLALSVYPGYARYAERAGRQIPVFRLTEVAAG